MNKRIQELAVAAAPANSSIPHSEWNIPKEFIEKFAELIVADCIRIVEGYCETSPEIYGLPLEILEHFDMELDDE